MKMWNSNEEEKSIADYTLTELQELIDNTYEKYKICKDKIERKELKNSFKAISAEYNRRVNFDAYKEAP